MTASKPSIAVIGAGIVGASLAWHLAARGARVTLIERGRPGAGVTARAFGWINVSHGEPGPYAQLRLRAIDEHRRIERDLGPAYQADWCGALTWTDDPAATERLVQDHAATGYDIHLIDRREIARREPNLKHPPETAAFAPSEAALDPAAATQALVEAAQTCGAEMLTAEAIEIFTDGTAVTGVRTSASTLACDIAVLAAGVDSRALVAPLGIDLPVDTSPALLLRFRSAYPLVNTIISGPEMEIRQAAPCMLLAAEDDSGEAPPAIGARALAAIRSGLRNGENLELEAVEVGIRPMPRDGLPIIGFLPGIAGIYAAVMHAGITLAPLAGRLAAVEILSGAADDMLAACRPGRFAR